MGSQIAAHFANAGVPSLLLDVTADAAAQGLKRARTLKPDPFFMPDGWKLVATASFDEGLPRLGEADWIVECVVEQLDVKRALLERVDAARRKGSVVSSNTSGIPIALLAAGRSDDFRRHWLGTHFFNPPRYLRLLEVDPDARHRSGRAGRRFRVCRPSPRQGRGGGEGLAELHRQPPGALRRGTRTRPRGGWRLLDRGDRRDHGATHRPAEKRHLPHARPRRHRHPGARRAQPRGAAHGPGSPRGRSCCRRSWTRCWRAAGPAKRRDRDSTSGSRAEHGESEILVIDPATLEYHPQSRPKLPALAAAEAVTDTGERIRKLFGGSDRVGEFLKRTLAPTLTYTAVVTPSIAHSPDDVDRVMRWGFGWELGPFEILDAVGIEAVLEAARATVPELLATGVPPLLARALASPDGRLRSGLIPPAAPGLQLLRAARDRSAIVKSNPGASLVDLGDGVLAVEFHSKMNAIGADTVQMLQAGVREAAKNFAAVVVGNEGAHFSAGANLMLVLIEAQDENWDELDLMVRAFQGATMGLRYADVPVVVGARRAGARRRLRDHPARRPRAGGGGVVHRPGGGGRRPDPGRRRHQGDDGARGGERRGRRRSAAADPEGLRDHRLRQDLDERSRRDAARLPAADRTPSR